MKNIFVIILSCLLAFPAYAQDRETSKEGNNILEDGLDKYAGQYNDLTLKSLSKLYWLKDAIPIDDDKAVDDFIRINDCEYYLDNWRNDLKWQKIRAATRMMIEDQKGNYTDKHRMIIPVVLGRYDPVRRGFPLIENSAIEDIQRVRMGEGRELQCGDKKNAAPLYPESVYLVLARPYSYDFLPLEEYVAAKFIERSNLREDAIFKEKEKAVKQHKRKVYLRFRMQLLEHQGTHRSSGPEGDSALMFGVLDGVDAFEHADETGLLSSIDF